MDIRHIALTTLTSRVDMDDLVEVAAALQNQTTRDFGPIWGIAATVDAFAYDQVPVGYWPIFVHDHVPDAAGVHLTGQGQPYALVQYGPTWSLTASHECMEMLVDPSGMMTKPGPSIMPDQGRVEYLVEICDPCESVSFAYSINGVTVSDFYTPHYFDPVMASGVRYSFRGEITGPRQILPEGYLAWRTSDGVWHQAITDAGGHLMARILPASASLGQRSFREFVDSQTPNHHQKLSNSVRTAGVAAALADARNASRPYSRRFLDDIWERFGVSAQPIK
jgi:hypothetical protein